MRAQKNVAVFSSEKRHAINVNHYVFIKYIYSVCTMLSFNSIAALRTHRKDHRVKTESKVTPITIFWIRNVLLRSNTAWLKCFRFLGKEKKTEKKRDS